MQAAAALKRLPRMQIATASQFQTVFAGSLSQVPQSTE